MQLDPFVGIAVLLAVALVGGMIAHRLRQRCRAAQKTGGNRTGKS